MAEPGYPQDHKDPSVFVDMSSHKDNDLSNSAPPPPFSDHEEDAVPLLSATDEKKAFDPAAPTPIPEDQSQNQEQKACGRRWGRRCNRTPEQRAACKAKARRVFRRLFAVGLLFWVYCAFFSSDYDYDDYDWESHPDYNDYVYVEGGSPSLMPLSTPSQSNLTPKQQTDLVFAMSESECMKHLIPWNGPSTISTDVRNIKLSIGKGNIFTNVVVRSSLFVDSPTFKIRANVTKNMPEDDDDGDDDDAPQEGPRGLHLERKEEDDSLEIILWADSNLNEPAEEPEEPVPPHHRHRHGRKHHKKHHKKHHHDKKHHGKKHHRKHHRKHPHDDESFWMKKRALHRRRFGDDEESSGHPKGQKFCASIDIEIVLPIDYNSIDSLSVNGVVLHATVEDDLAPVFGEGIDSLEINAIIGEIKTRSVRANTLKANVVAGNIHIENVQAATPGTAIHARVASIAANITLGVTTTTIDKPEEDDGGGDDGGDDGGEDIKSGRLSKRGGDDDGDDDDGDDDDDKPCRRHSHHLVKTLATAGNIHVKVTEAEDDWIDKLKHKAEQIPGMLVVRSGTSGGDIHTSIDLIDDRQLSLKSESIAGKIHARVSDKFLGSFKVGTLFGTAEVIEAKDSPSTIDYSKNRKNAKVGRKIIVRDGDEDDDDEDNSVLGDIVLGSPVSRATLEFF
ncbi:hypothetical protein BGZ47_005101 [Haplosporangium gracile]|nr:hypothetical protein BGZ47_005101 [Haplosporangium gracile]